MVNAGIAPELRVLSCLALAHAFDVKQLKLHYWHPHSKAAAQGQETYYLIATPARRYEEAGIYCRPNAHGIEKLYPYCIDLAASTSSNGHQART